MQLSHPLKLHFVGLIAASLLFIANDAPAATAVITNMNGAVSVHKPDGSLKLLSQKSEVDTGDVISTEKNSFARLKFTDGGEITIRPESVLTIDAYSFEETKPEQDSFIFGLIKGGFRTITGLIGKRGNRDAYRANSTTATIGIRGTDYGSLLCQANCGKLPDGQYIDVKQGKINVSNKAGSLDVDVGQYAYVKDAETTPVLLLGDPGLPGFNEEDTVGAGLGTFITGVIPEGAGCFVQ
jgi:hypothetical protein